MILDIKTYPNKILTRKTKRVIRVDENIKKIINDMVETLYAKRGAGLSANQVGIDKQIFVCDLGDDLKIFINPKILKKKGRAISEEGCLSFPGLYVSICRPDKIEVSYLDKNGQPKKIKASDLLARVICHEMDHLNGKTMLDRVGFLKRMSLKKSLREKNNK